MLEHGPVGVVIPVDGTTDKFVAGVGKDVVLVTWSGDKDEKNLPVKVLLTVEPSSSNTRINDGKVDSSGRFWFGKLKIS